MQTGIEHMLETRKDKDLKAAFQLISVHEPSLKLAANVLEPYIRKKGENLYNDDKLKRDPRSKQDYFTLPLNRIC